MATTAVTEKKSRKAPVVAPLEKKRDRPNVDPL